MDKYKVERDGAIIEKDGEKTENLHRDNIEQQKFDSLQTALSNGNHDKAVEIMAKILAGDEILQG